MKRRFNSFTFAGNNTDLNFILLVNNHIIHIIYILDIKVSIKGNGLRTSVHYKPTDSLSYLLHSSSHPSHVKNSIPYSQCLRLRRLCSDDSDFSNKSQEMCQFFEKRGYPASVIQTAHHRTQQTDRQSALQTSQKEN